MRRTGTATQSRRWAINRIAVHKVGGPTFCRRGVNLGGLVVGTIQHRHGAGKWASNASFGHTRPGQFG